MSDYGVPDALTQPAVLHETRPITGTLEKERIFRIAVLIHIACQLADHNLSESLRGLAEEVLDMNAEKLETRFAEGMTERREWSQLLSLPEHAGTAPDSVASPQKSTYDEPVGTGAVRDSG